MTTKKSTKKKTTKTKVVSVGEQRDKNLEVAKIIVAVQHFDSGVAKWNGVDGKTYSFTRDKTLGKHILEFDSIEEYEAERENLIHNKAGIMMGYCGFQVMIVTVAQFEEIEKKRREHEKNVKIKQEALAKAQKKVEEEVNEAEKQLEEAREKLGAVKLKSTSLNIE